MMAVVAASQSHADEGGVSLWIPGTFGSLAAVPGNPGFGFASVYYHTSVDAKAGRTFPVAGLEADDDLVFLAPSYTFAPPVLGGQLALSVTGIFGRVKTSIAATLTGPLGNTIGESLTEALSSVGDLFPMATLKWNRGVHNFMVYGYGDIPVGDYSPNRIANVGNGFGGIDGGFGYTYFDPTKGHEFSVVSGLTYNFTNPDTQYKNGIDWHVDWGASQFLSKQLLVGLVGYGYKQLTCDSGAGATLGCFESQVFGIGPQIGYILPMGQVQAYLGLKGYYEFEAENRPDGWNAWLTIAFSPAGAPPPPAHTPTIRK